jgi:hypothetical protein
MRIVRLLKQTVLEWYRSRTLALGAALACRLLRRAGDRAGLYGRQPGSRQRGGTREPHHPPRHAPGRRRIGGGSGVVRHPTTPCSPFLECKARLQ